MPKYGMVIKSNLCTGCQTCTVACKMENLTLPGCNRTTVSERIDAKWEIRICMQCENPPCVSACPVNATWKNDMGIIVVDQDKCIGCKKCISACPYQARKINPKRGYFKERLPFEDVSIKIKEKHRIHKATKADKCDFCLHRLNINKTPICVEACPTGARIFGDTEDSQSEVSKLINKGASPLRPELGTKPKVFFI